MTFVCPLTLQDHLIKALYALWLEACQGYMTKSSMLGGHRHCGSGDIMALVCEVLLQDHTIKVLCDFIGRKSIILPSLYP